MSRVFVSFLVLFLAENMYFFCRENVCILWSMNPKKQWAFSMCYFSLSFVAEKIMHVQRKCVLTLDLFLAKKRHMDRERTCVYHGTLGCN